jgi:hypothetical protein
MSTRFRNGTVLAGLGVLIGTMFVGPSLYVKAKGRSLVERQGPLTGSQVQRGPYLNSGSRDAGVDPDWDMTTRTWRGHRPQN